MAALDTEDRFAIDLFAGAGGLTAGLKRAGWNTTLAIESDPVACATYRQNFPDVNLLETDIRDISFRDFRGHVDLLAGGPPCQPFSVAGAQRSKDDIRDMLPQFARAVDEARPSAFLIENVSGLTGPKHRAYLEASVDQLVRLGYHVSHQVLNAADYGVPQFRRRIFIVGFQKGTFLFPQPTHGPQGAQSWVSSGQVLSAVPPDAPNTAIVTYAKKPVLRPSPFAGMLVNGGGRPIKLSEPSPTIPASAGGNRTHIVDKDGVLLQYHRHLMRGGQPRRGEVPSVRRLTIRESARLQSFSDSFIFSGSRSAQYRQIGNAVPPGLAQAIAQEVASYMNAQTNHKLRTTSETVA